MGMTNNRVKMSTNVTDVYLRQKYLATHSMIVIKIYPPLPQIASQIFSVQENKLFFFLSMFLQPPI